MNRYLSVDFNNKYKETSNQLKKSQLLITFHSHNSFRFFLLHSGHACGPQARNQLIVKPETFQPFVSPNRIFLSCCRQTSVTTHPTPRLALGDRFDFANYNWLLKANFLEWRRAARCALALCCRCSSSSVSAIDCDAVYFNSTLLLRCWINIA